MRKLKQTEVTFTLEAEEEHIPVRGNVLCSGDDALDRATEDEIIARLDRGDVWAWACVTVTATYTMPDSGETLVGRAYLGGCSYAGAEDFKRDGYYEDMKIEALEELHKAVSAEIMRGAELAAHFRG
jgi:hypothetical protein